jgi:hypothetical protein
VTGRLNVRVDEAGAKVVKVSTFEEVVTEDFLHVGDDDPDNAARLQCQVTRRQQGVCFALLPVVKPVLEVLKEVSCVNLVDGTRIKGGEVFECVSLDLIRGLLVETAKAPNVVVYAVINVDPAGLVVWA